MRMLTAWLRPGAPTIGEGSGRSRGQGRGTWHGVAALLLVSSGLGLDLGFAQPASAQVAGLYWQCVAGDPARLCPVSVTYPLPNGLPVNGMLPVAGTQRGTAIASSTALTIPAGATVAVVQAQGTGATSGGQCLFWQDDGTAPTGTAGQILVPNQTLVVSGVALTAFHAIAASGSGASCTLTASYYK